MRVSYWFDLFFFFLLRSFAVRQLVSALRRHQLQRTVLLARCSRHGRELPSCPVPWTTLSHTDGRRIFQFGTRRVCLGRTIQSRGVLRLHILMVNIFLFLSRVSAFNTSLPNKLFAVFSCFLSSIRSIRFYITFIFFSTRSPRRERGQPI